MPITLIGKIKQKNSGTFKLLDYLDIEGRITGWQNPVKKIFATIAAVTAAPPAEGESFIISDCSAETWTDFANLDIYGNTATYSSYAIYQMGAAGKVYLVTAASAGMIALNIEDSKLKVFGTSWTDLITGGGTGTPTYQTLRYSEELSVLIGSNYNTTTKHLNVGSALQAGDNVNVYVNGLKYSHIGTDNAFTFSTGTSVLVWIPLNVGFDLVDGDYIEIEIFNNE